MLLAGRNGLVQIVQVASSLVIARLIAPDAYGTFAIAITAVGFARYVGDLGVSNRFLALPKLDDALIRTGSLIALLCALAATIVLIAAAPLLAALLDGPSYSELLIRVLAVTLLVDALRFGATVSLNRNLRFGSIGVVTLTETLVMYAVQIGLLLLGVGIWALVIAQVARSLVGTSLILKVGGWFRPRRETAMWPLVRRGLPFQGPAIVGAAMGFVIPVLLSVCLEAEGIGFWAWATVLAAPISAVVLVISGVSLPSLVRLRESDPTMVPRATALMLRASILVPAAAAGVLLGFAPAIVDQVFGPQWNPALGAVELNLIGVLPATFSYFLGAVLESEQRAGVRLSAGLIASLAGIPTLLWLATTWDVTGAAFVTAIFIPTLDVAILAVFAKVHLLRAIAGGAVVFAICALATTGLEQLADSVPLLLGLLVLSAPIAVVTLWFADREAARAVLRFGVPLPARVRGWLQVAQTRPSGAP